MLRSFVGFPSTAVLALLQHRLIADRSRAFLLFRTPDGERPRGQVLEEGRPILLLALLHPVPVESEGTAVDEAPYGPQCVRIPQQCALGQGPNTVGA